ncbi:hypothetical protein DNM94_25060, partial [Salmonella enterica subsp. enterica serovar Potsdam]|nr:hypothetical protein [Salmonella enterica subsp. enterica serovar Potsdam]
LELLSKVKRARRQFAKIAGEVLNVFDGDTGAAFGLLACDDAVNKFSLDEYQHTLKRGGVMYSQFINKRNLYEVS